MNAASSTQKQLIDYLWDWTENYGDWAKLLVCKIVASETLLTPDERQEVFDYFLQAAGVKSGLPSIKITKPIYAPAARNVRLVSLSDIKGVNKLAPNQSIGFSNNITVIYGENGSGKTGYGRILKALGYSYDPLNKVHCNVEKASENQTAAVNYQVDGTDALFTWNGSDRNADLNCLSVFNNNCVAISLSENRSLLVSPIGFHLFSIVTDELGYLTQMLQKEFDRYPRDLSWISLLHPGTEQHQFISNLKATSSQAKLLELAKFDGGDNANLEIQLSELKKLNRSLLETEIATGNLQSSELGNLIAQVNTTCSLLTQENWNSLNGIIRKIKALDGQTAVGLKDLAEKNSIQLYESAQFKAFIQAADGYLKVLDRPTYPEMENDICLYCLQPLKDAGSLELLRAYKALLNDNTQTLVKKETENKAKIVNAISGFKMKVIFHQSTFGTDDKGNPSQPPECETYNKTVEATKKGFISEDLNENTEFKFDPSSFETFITKKKADIDSKIQEKRNILDELSKEEARIQRIIDELTDKKLFSEKFGEVISAMKNKAVIAKLVAAKPSLNTNLLSRKTTEAREGLVQQHFTKIFQNELKALRKSSIPVTLNFGTSKGQSKLQQRIHDHYTLGEILSEGEQKAIALAEFLTELQLDNSNGPVIFDDPVNSLDHIIIDDVSRRLIKLSQQRQVIIFTHNILLFNSILHDSGLTIYKGNLDAKFFDIKSEYGTTGVISENQAEEKKVKKFTGEIKQLIQNAKSSGRPEGVVAAEGFGLLRSAIEIGVEHQLFRGTVKRYQKNIALTLLVQVNGLKLDEHKVQLNEIYERCCGYTNAHSNPEQVTNDPKISELQIDLESFDSILKDFN